MLINNSNYFTALENIKRRIRITQYRAALGANKELIELYWQIGKVIIENTKYGAKFVENLSKDILSEFPEIQGFSPRNLKYMRKFAGTYPDFTKVQHVVALLPWRNNLTLISKIKDESERLWYIEQNIENGWNNNTLTHNIETKLFQRQVEAKKTANYQRVLEMPFSELAEETLKSPYVFDFVQKRKGIIEREIEKELVANIAKTIMELGTGFAFVGNQYHIEVSEKDYYIDLLFYNTKLRCYVIIELKNTEFKPEYAGKLNFYLSAIDDTLKHETDNPSIGIMLCQTKDKLTAEYALKDINKPIGVSEYKLSDFVPSEFIDTLPSAEDIEKRVKLEYDVEGDVFNER
ncbi:MAG: PDDEXK nuclease domain-containing protein [Defluviitaleaceae bacterium]|nr:PDDEXK nuclease domain-containing protein [Defluviitaleaceae bacterium]